MPAGPILLIGGALILGLVLAASGAKAETKPPSGGGGGARAPGGARVPPAGEEPAPEGPELTEDEAWTLVAEAQASSDPEEILFKASELREGGWGEGENDLASELEGAVELYESVKDADQAEAAIVELLNAGFAGLANALAEKFDLEKGPTEDEARKEYERSMGFSDVQAVGRVMEMLYSWGHVGLGNGLNQVITLYNEGLGADPSRVRQNAKTMTALGFGVLANEMMHQRPDVV